MVRFMSRSHIRFKAIPFDITSLAEIEVEAMLTLIHVAAKRLLATKAIVHRLIVRRYYLELEVVIVLMASAVKE